jgi:hypothetical protein
MIEEATSLLTGASFFFFSLDGLEENFKKSIEAIKNVQHFSLSFRESGENDKLRQIIQELISNYKSANEATTVNNYIGSYFDFIINYLSNLTLLQQGAVAHISASFFIFFCLNSILSAIFGDFLITYFKLEEK